MRRILRFAMLAALALSACRRPAAENPWAWEKDPGLDPHPTGQTPQGPAGPALQDVTFRIDPARGTKVESVADAQPATEEESLYLRAARSGQAWAQTKIGIKYVQDSDDLARLGEGLRWLNAAADQNDTEALRALSALAAAGRGMDQSDKEAYKYMSRAAELGSPEAQYELANMLANGRGMPRDMEAAIIWARKAAALGYAAAQVYVGRALVSSIEQERKTEGVDFLQKAAEAGQAEAALFLAGLLAGGQFGLAKDELRAEKLLLPFAEGGNADCQFVLAALYQTGEAFTDRRDEAQKWLRRAAEGGSLKAIEALQGTNKLADAINDQSRYEDAAARGEAEAQRQLGKMYVEKTENPELIARGIDLLESAAARGDAEALFALGGLAMAGRGMPQSASLGVEYCRKAAELGLADAQYELAYMYASGRVVAADEEKALEWGQKAVDQGSIKAMHSVGRLLLQRARPEDQSRAVQLLAKAAESGIADAAIFLAEAYAGGLYGLEENPNEAVRILRPLADRGLPQAREAMQRIAEPEGN